MVRKPEQPAKTETIELTYIPKQTVDSNRSSARERALRFYNRQKQEQKAAAENGGDKPGAEGADGGAKGSGPGAAGPEVDGADSNAAFDGLDKNDEGTCLAVGRLCLLESS